MNTSRQSPNKPTDITDQREPAKARRRRPSTQAASTWPLPRTSIRASRLRSHLGRTPSPGCGHPSSTPTCPSHRSTPGAWSGTLPPVVHPSF
ncbi:hypothetical protein C0J52_24537 [Blattella germanica]|nr:hypothetical protein C0J52_24537 [Blattella germanica]